VRLIVWCKQCRHRVEPDPAEQAERERLVCSRCGGREIDMVVTGERR
jgi:Zn finger protein HypA/HybF involved in hydrogenase expression